MEAKVCETISRHYGFGNIRVVGTGMFEFESLFLLAMTVGPLWEDISAEKHLRFIDKSITSQPCHIWRGPTRLAPQPANKHLYGQIKTLWRGQGTLAKPKFSIKVQL